MKIFIGTAVFIFVLLPFTTSDNVSDNHKLSNETQSAYSRLLNYDGQSVISCEAEGLSITDLNTLYGKYDIMSTIAGHMHIRVMSEEERTEVEKITTCEFMYDVEAAVSSYETNRNKSLQGVDWFDTYHNFDELVDWYKATALLFPDTATFVESIGESVEGRKIPAFHITAPKTDNEPNRRKVWIQCVIHAREWLSATTCNYIVQELLIRYDKGNRKIVKLLKKTELIVIPIVNPDGYVYTWTNDRFWRKNRSKSPVSTPWPGCVGTDLNRNYDVQWSSGIGTSTSPCSNTYKGTSPASEPEIVATTNYFLKNAPIYGALDIHTYSQLLLSPYGATDEPCPDNEVFEKLMNEMENAIYSIHNTIYSSKPIIDFYPVSASSVDFFYGEGIRTTNGGVRAYSLAFELRDEGEYGFLVPEDQIRPNGEEIFPSIMLFMKTAITSPLSYPERCIDTKLKFKTRHYSNKKKSCAWVAKKQQRIEKFCRKKKKFGNGNKWKPICSMCCEVCLQSTCNL